MRYLNPDEIRDLKEGGYDRFLLEARCDSERWEAANSLREVIEAAFAGVTLGGGIGLKEGDGITTNTKHEMDRVSASRGGWVASA